MNPYCSTANLKRSVEGQSGVLRTLDPKEAQVRGTPHLYRWGFSLHTRATRPSIGSSSSLREGRILQPRFADIVG